MLQNFDIFSLDQTDSAKDVINRINVLRNDYLAYRRDITLKMIKGYLDYHCINLNMFKWRYEAVYNYKGEPKPEDEEAGLGSYSSGFKNTLNYDCLDKSAEQYYNLEYSRYKLCQEKIDEIYNNISSRNFSVTTKSLVYPTTNYIFNSLLSQQFDAESTKKEIRKAQYQGLIKGTGFLRPFLYDQKIKQYTANITSENIKNFKYTEKEVYLNKGLTIESVDPETVFVNPSEKDPKKGFFITPYTADELVCKYPFLKDYVSEYQNPETIEKNKKITDPIHPEVVYDYHIAELLHEMYEAKDLSDVRFQTFIVENKYLLPSGSPALFSMDNASTFWQYLTTGNITYSRRLKTYFVTEYYDILEDLYVVYIGNTLLYKGHIFEPFKSFPAIPVYMDNKEDGNFYGRSVAEYFAEMQNSFNKAKHNQNKSSLITGQPIFMVTDDLINEEYHPNKQLSIALDAPYTEMHVKATLNDMDIPNQTPIVPLQLNNGSENIQIGLKQEAIQLADRLFPSTKVLHAQDTPEMRTEMMFDRDLYQNEIIKRLSSQLSLLAGKIFSCIIFELSYFGKSNQPIPFPYDQKMNSNLIVKNTEKDIDKAKQDKLEELKKIYEQDINDQIQVLSQNQNLLQQILGQIRPQVESQILLKAYQRLPQNDQERIQMFQQLSPEYISALNNTTEQMVNQQLREIASQSVKLPMDTDIYFSFEKLNLIGNMTDKSIVFSFDKSKQEKQKDINNLINFLKPFENFTPYALDLQSVFMSALDAVDMPASIVRDKVPSPEQMTLLSQMRANLFGAIDKDPIIMAAFINEKVFGKEVITPEQIIKNQQVTGQIQNEIKKDEIAARGNVKTTTDIIKKSAEEQMKNAINQNQPVDDNMVMNYALDAVQNQ